MPSRLLAGVLVGIAVAGCSSADPGTRWSRHFDDSIWGGAVGQQVSRPDRLIPEAALATLIPVAYVYDRRIHDHTEERSVGKSTETFADVLQVVVPLIPLSIGLIQMSEGDDGRRLEATVEALAATVAVQQGLAWAIHRKRPDETDHLSFPSGHTGWLFAATTLIVRQLHDPADDSFHPLDVLLYAPAVFSGWERIADSRHWTSDVAVGAFLGMFITNVIWDAHFSGTDQNRRVILPDEDAPRETGWTPGFEWSDGVLVLSFQRRF